MEGQARELRSAPVKKKRIQRKPTAFEKRVEARVTRNVAADLGQSHALTETATAPPAEASPVPGPEFAQRPSEAAPVPGPGSAQPDSPFDQALRLLRSAELAGSPKALRLLADLAELAQGGQPAPSARASHVIQPSGGGLPAPDLRAEYERRLASLRPGDIAGLMELKREFRKRGLEVY